MTERRTFRCAIYTRKSTEEGLDQDFNSLHAQREASEAYIRSQAHEGWRAVPTAYDDAGYSGGTMNRPALEALLADIKERRVDVVVVYKIDRLTRSLADFARIVEVLEANGASFVSVTQAFNTTTSMGRLTLNVLLSFAQFEREVTAERIRDKIAASKKKGMWMGGRTPLGYNVSDGRLVVNEAEAETVRTLFKLCLELRSVRLLKEKADDLRLLTKVRREASGKVVGGRPFSRGHLYALLANPIYIGQTSHKGKVYPGQHPAIIDEQLWSAVRRLLAEGTPARSRSGPPGEGSLLAGLVFDETGDRLSPTHAVKKGVRYRYYVSQRLLREPRGSGDGWRLPAQELERVVIEMLAETLKDQSWLVSELKLDAVRPDQLQASLAEAKSAAESVLLGAPSKRRTFLRDLVERITIEPSSLSMHLRRTVLCELISFSPNDGQEGSAVVVRTRAIALRRRGSEAKLIVGNGELAQAPRKPDPMLIKVVAQAHRAFSLLSRGEASSIKELAAKIGSHPSDITRILPFAFLAPDMVIEALEGKHAIGLTAQRLTRWVLFPSNWAAQRRAATERSGRGAVTSSGTPWRNRF